jgi:hypothetical protein
MNAGQEKLLVKSIYGVVSCGAWFFGPCGSLAQVERFLYLFSQAFPQAITISLAKTGL